MADRVEFKPGNMLNPTPVVMVSCRDKDNRDNIITVAWVGTVCSNPPMVSISVRPERYSYDCIKETGEFAINIVNRELTYAADFCGVKSGRDMDKFDCLGLEKVHLSHINCSGIGGSPAILECKVKDIIPLGCHHMFLAEIVGVSADSSLMDGNAAFHINDGELVVYSHGEYRLMGEKIGKFGYSVEKKK